MNSPASTVGGRPASRTEPTVVQVVPSGDSAPATVSPVRVSRSQRGELVLTATAGRDLSGSGSSRRLVSEVTRTVMLPSPVSGRCAKAKLSTTTSPPGPSVGAHSDPGPFRPHGPCMPGSRANRIVAPAPATAATTQPRTVRNFVNSARSTWPKAFIWPAPGARRETRPHRG
ncbi:hypothetical protein [Parafrankia sp. EAN1pec]|uniref:hypothetical protein n=1 Tax=Parafrankia sp. (strain EAN1pec) TaxID=298653 RepID=UPI0032197200